MPERLPPLERLPMPLTPRWQLPTQLPSARPAPPRWAAEQRALLADLEAI
jgi:hypothetical protein